MGRSHALFVGLVLVLVVGVPHGDDGPVAAAQGAETLRIATLAPRGSQWMRVFQAWDASLKKETKGRLSLQVSPSPAGTRDEALVGRLRAGQLDGATLTVAGLAQTAPATVVLAVPGVYRDLDVLDRVRRGLDDELDPHIRESGFARLGWVDLGGVRLLSKDVAIRRPEDLRGRRPWSGVDDVVFSEILRAVGAKPVRLALGEVRAALRTGRVDVVPASAVGALSMGWHAEVSHMSAEPHWPLVGATLLRREAYDALSSDLRGALDRTGDRAHATLRKLMRRDDDKAHATITGRGVTAVEWERAAWKQATQKARRQLAKRYFSTSLLERAEGLAR
jgi:TRAP-type transport system periplasmic protein